MNEPQDLPQRYRESTFRDYEPLIKLVLAAQDPYPQATRFWPRQYGKALATFSCRFRDAMKSFRDNKWPSDIDQEHFLKVFPTLQVSERSDGSVLVGTPKAIEHFVKSGSNEVPLSNPLPTSGTATVDMSLTAHELIATLSSNRLLAPRIVLTNISQPEIELLQASFDIAIDTNPDGTYTLI